MKKYIQICTCDTVAVALETLMPGEKITVKDSEIKITENIPAGHKFALQSIAEGEKIIKYGFPIGAAICRIEKGAHVHCHNIRSLLNEKQYYRYEPNFLPLSPKTPCTFEGYRRKDGKVGVRNEVWIIPTVGCVNNIAKAICKHFNNAENEHTDGVFAYCHPYGCSQLGDDQLNTQKVLCGLIQHPNAAGVLVLGLGCENNNINELKAVLGDYDSERVKFLVCQDAENEIEDGIRIVQGLLEKAKQFRREKCDVSSLIIGLKCGGSDGFSGITANPAVGKVSDLIIQMGGSAVLTEVPEMFGAETILMNRCRTKEIFDKTVTMIENFKSYYRFFNEPIDENPSPGNKEGGISTLADKALGCTQKGGNAPVEDVLSYGSMVKKKGLSLLCAPGNDLVASCALAAAGAQIILFTTGRGTPFGCPVPTIKISSNTPLFYKKNQWIDFNAGQILDGTDITACAGSLLNFILDTASGKKVKSEFLDKSDLAIFKNGITL